MKNKKYFFEAITLAESVKGYTSPNPAVGCIIVKNNEVVGKGATKKFGFDHAEIIALKEAGSRAKGAVMYVTLEPCVEFIGKKTQSCTKKIIESGIKEIFIGIKDPNPKINGNGIKLLKKNGIKVRILSDFTKDVEILNEDFFKFIKTGTPFIYAKCAMTLDGNIASINGDSKWISSEESRLWVHQLRNKVDSVLVGVGTILQDNPKLNVRTINRIKDPLRIIIDPFGKTPVESLVMSDNLQSLFIVNNNIENKFIDLCIKNNKKYAKFSLNDGKISLKEVVDYLGKQLFIESLLIEGGSKIFYNAYHEKIIDKMIIFIAPIILGGKGIPLFNGNIDINISDAFRIRDVSVENIGGDILIQGYLNGRSES